MPNKKSVPGSGITAVGVSVGTSVNAGVGVTVGSGVGVAPGVGVAVGAEATVIVWDTRFPMVS